MGEIPQLVPYRADALAAHRIIFGDQRLSDIAGHQASPDTANDFLALVHTAVGRPLDGSVHSDAVPYSRNLSPFSNRQLLLFAGIHGGSKATDAIPEPALASVHNISRTTRLFSPVAGSSGIYVQREHLYFDERSERLKVAATLKTHVALGKRIHYVATKWATEAEAQAALEVITNAWSACGRTAVSGVAELDKLDQILHAETDSWKLRLGHITTGRLANLHIGKLS